MSHCNNNSKAYLKKKCQAQPDLPHFVSFVPRLPQIAHVLQFALDADMCIHCIEPGACSTGHSIPGFFVEKTGPPKFLGSLLYSFAMLTRPRSDGTFLTKTKRPCCPHAFKDEGSNKSTFEAQSHRFRIRCLRFAMQVTQNTTQDSLLAAG